MKISEKQILQLMQIANGVLLLKVPESLKYSVGSLLDKINNQQSDELKAIE